MRLDLFPIKVTLPLNRLKYRFSDAFKIFILTPLQFLCHSQIFINIIHLVASLDNHLSDLFKTFITKPATKILQVARQSALPQISSLAQTDPLTANSSLYYLHLHLWTTKAFFFIFV